MPKKYTGGCVPAIVGWLTKMGRYCRLIEHLADVWVDVIATHIIDAAQDWLDKALQDVQLGQLNPWIN